LAEVQQLDLFLCTN